MANPQDTGTFDYWITDRITFQDTLPKSSDTGTFETWLWDRKTWATYVEAAAAPPPTAALPIFPPPDAIHSLVFGGVTVR